MGCWLAWVMVMAAFFSTGSIGAADRPTLEIGRVGDSLRLQFTGTLQSAPALEGPWTDLPAAASPLTLEASGNRQFFRSFDNHVPGIFSSSSIIAWTLTAPFQTNFGLAFAGVPDGFIPPRREKPYFPGVLTLESNSIPVTLRVRGNSSLQECPFPKLKFKVSKENRAGTPFAEAREIKIGTHCAEGGRGTIGRLRDERATYREALAYEIMDHLGFVTPRVRRAEIEFRDTSPTNEFQNVGWQLTRKAMILEDIEVVAERLGGVALSDEELTNLRDAQFGSQLITDLQFLHILLGNWDYKLSVDGQGLWNTDVLKLANGTYLPVAGDFDLSSWVTELVKGTTPPDYHPDLPDLDRRARYELGQLRESVGRQVFQNAKDRFLTARGGIESLVTEAEIDDAGRTNAFRHILAFFEALSANP